MVFYGTKQSIEQWRELVRQRLSKQGSTIVQSGDVSFCFSVELTAEERDILQEEFWYKTEDDAPLDALGRHMKWNDRVAFAD
jgi:hypothetical protein